MKISIITTVKNNPIGIYLTIKSVLNQSVFKKIEYIIVDASNDVNTNSLINQLIKAKKNIRLIKSLDHNIYEGINKGIKNANGEYIGILNSGDLYYSKNVIENILNILNKKKYVNLICGNLIYFNSHKITRFWSMNPILHGKLDVFKIAHPTTFIKKNILKINNYYSTNFNISSDFKFFFDTQKYFNNKTHYIKKNIIFMREGGLSTSYLKIHIKIFEDLKILISNYNFLFLFFYIKKIFIKIPLIFYQKKNYFKILLLRLEELDK